MSDPDNRSHNGSIPIFLRLRENGTRDPGFGDDGIAHPRLHGRSFPNRVAAAPGGGIVFSGVTRGYEDHPYVGRLTRDGSLDHRFGRLGQRALMRLPRDAGFVWSHELIALPGGHIDLIGDFEGRDKTFILRLNRNGTRVSSFGRDGMQKLPWLLLGATGDGRNGEILDLNRFATNAFYRLGPDGRLREPALRLAIDEEEGPKLEAQPGGRIFVFDRGLWACRQNCYPQVTVYRLRLR